jgi:uncharacterized membrane protein
MMFFPHHEPGQFGYLFAILGGLSWLAIVAGIVLLVIWAVRALPRTTLMAGAAAVVESPEDILARRFVMGEISAEDFARARDLLRGGSATTPPGPTA